MPASDAVTAFEARFPVVSRIPVAWGDMDAFAHVNNTVYFRYFETARIACFEVVGFTELMRESRIGPILAHTECRFRLPLEYPDTVSAATRIEEIDVDRFMMRYEVFSHAHGRVAAEGTGRIVSLNYATGEKVALPGAIVEKLRELS